MCWRPSMKGDGEEGIAARDFLSLGSGSSRLRASLSRKKIAEETGEPCSRTWSSLARNGLNMLAGVGNGGFSLKPPPVGSAGESFGMLENGLNSTTRSSRSLSCGGFTGGVFTGFGGASSSTVRPFANEETQSKDAGLGGSSSLKGNNSLEGKKVEGQDDADIQNLSREECWKLILKLGTRWPSWKKSEAAQSSQGYIKEQGVAPGAVDRSYLPVNDDRFIRGDFEALQLGQSSLKSLASRALEELARTPDRSGAVCWGMQAPKRGFQENIARTAAGDGSTPTTKASGAPVPTFSQSRFPSPFMEPTSTMYDRQSPSAPGTRTIAPLTIFYAGTVNICENVPEEKALLIMALAERAGLLTQAQRHGQIGSFSAPRRPVSPSRSLAQSTTALDTTPSHFPETRSQQQTDCSDLPRPSPQTGTRSVLPSELTPTSQAEASSFVQGPVESSNPMQTAVVQEPRDSQNHIKLTTSASTMQRQQAAHHRPLPNARKNSLARFLDSRQKRARGNTSCSDDLSSKKPTLSSETGPSDFQMSDSQKDGCKAGKAGLPLCSQSLMTSKEDAGVVSSLQNLAEVEGKGLALENQAVPMEN